jgi:hypothetical protein
MIAEAGKLAIGSPTEIKRFREISTSSQSFIAIDEI